MSDSKSSTASGDGKELFHPIASIFPLFKGQDLERLAADIKEYGLREPVYLYEGKILDGRNRAAACEMVGIALRTREFRGTRLEALAFVWSENFQRRHLNPGQAAVAEAKRTKLCIEYGAEVEKMKEEAETERRGRIGKARRGETAEKVTPSQKAQRETSTTRASAIGTNRRYLEAATRLLDEAPEKLESVESGEKSLSEVLREVRREEVQAGLAAMPSEKYRVLYADPPWSYGNSGVISDADAYSATARHYPSITIAELCALGVRGIATDNAVLFLWVTSPLLAECWPVIKAWGFEYKTSFVWDKMKHNFGHYNSVRHEFLLVCVRGSCTPDNKTLHDSVISIERSKTHSEKPEKFREIIDVMYPKGKRIELFARKPVEGWDAWGNEAET